MPVKSESAELVSSQAVKQKKHSQWRDVWRRLCRNKPAMVSLVVIILLILIAVFAEAIAPYNYSAQDLPNKFQFPSWQHLFGTDNFGRDILSRVIYGARVSLLVAIMGLGISIVIGGLLGATTGYFGGFYEGFIMRLMDVLMAIPSFLLAVSIQSALGTGLFNTALAIGIGGIPGYARLMRANVMVIKENEFVEAARASGAGHTRIIFKHIIPNVLAPIIVESTLRIGANIMAISGLSFIGLGVQPPTPEWGAILSVGRTYIRDFWPLSTFPGIAIMITLFAFNLLGDGLRDALDPRLKQ